MQKIETVGDMIDALSQFPRETKLEANNGDGDVTHTPEIRVYLTGYAEEGLNIPDVVIIDVDN